MEKRGGQGYSPWAPPSTGRFLKTLFDLWLGSWSGGGTGPSAYSTTAVDLDGREPEQCSMTGLQPPVPGGGGRERLPLRLLRAGRIPSGQYPGNAGRSWTGPGGAGLPPGVPAGSAECRSASGILCGRNGCRRGPGWRGGGAGPKLLLRRLPGLLPLCPPPPAAGPGGAEASERLLGPAFNKTAVRLRRTAVFSASQRGKSARVRKLSPSRAHWSSPPWRFRVRWRSAGALGPYRLGGDGAGPSNPVSSDTAFFTSTSRKPLGPGGQDRAGGAAARRPQAFSRNMPRHRRQLRPGERQLLGDGGLDLAGDVPLPAPPSP